MTFSNQFDPGIATTLFRADFDSVTLDAAWNIQNENPAHWSLAANPSSLQIVSQRGEFFVPTKPENVFLFDPQSSTVKKAEISRRGVQGNQLVVTDGVAPGDVVVVAGVTFLSDGQKVKLMPEQGAPEEEALPAQSWLTSE